MFAGIPSLNEEEAIASVVVRTQEHADKVLVVDDGSEDATALIAERLGAQVMRHDRNLGKGAALGDCFDWAKKGGADVLVTLDGDGQHDPSRIPDLVDALIKKGADVVIGSRMKKPHDMPWHRWRGARMLDYATLVKIDGRYVDSQSGFRAYSRKAIENLVVAEYGMGVDAEVIMRAHRAGMQIVELPLSVGYAGLDTSTHHPAFHAMDVFFSIAKFLSIRHPLLFYGGISMIVFLVSLVFGIMTLDYYQKYGVVVTNLALISLISGVLGFLALSTGIILFTLITVLREIESRLK